MQPYSIRIRSYTNPDLPNSFPVVVLPKEVSSIKMNASCSDDFRASLSYNSFKDKHIMNLFAGTEGTSGRPYPILVKSLGYQYEKGGYFYDYLIFKQGIEQNNYYYNDLTYSRNLAFFGMATYSYGKIYSTPERSAMKVPTDWESPVGSLAAYKFERGLSMEHA